MAHLVHVKVSIGPHEDNLIAFTLVINCTNNGTIQRYSSNMNNVGFNEKY